MQTPLWEDLCWSDESSASLYATRGATSKAQFAQHASDTWTSFQTSCRGLHPFCFSLWNAWARMIAELADTADTFHIIALNHRLKNYSLKRRQAFAQLEDHDLSRASIEAMAVSPHHRHVSSHGEASAHASSGSKNCPCNAANDSCFRPAKVRHESLGGWLRTDICSTRLDLHHHWPHIYAQLLEPLVRVVAKGKAKRLPASAHCQPSGLSSSWVDHLFMHHLVPQCVEGLTCFPEDAAYHLLRWLRGRSSHDSTSACLSLAARHVFSTLCYYSRAESVRAQKTDSAGLVSQ